MPHSFCGVVTVGSATTIGMGGEYATPYNSGDAPRTQNLTRGAELVNGTVVKPGEVFSLEKVLTVVATWLKPPPRESTC